MAFIYNYLVHMRSVVRSMKTQTYLVVVAHSTAEAEDVAKRLAALMPGTVTVLSVQEV